MPQQTETTDRTAFTQQDTLLLKGAAAVMILAHHLFTYDYRLAEGVGYFSMGSYYGSKYETILGAFCQIGLSLFLVLGGYGTWLSWQRAANKPRKLAGKLGGLYIGYWKVFVIFVPLAVLLHDPMVQLTPGLFLQNLLALAPTYNAEWWFMPVYLLLTLLFPVIWLAFRGRRPAWADAALVILFDLAATRLLPLALAFPALGRLQQTLPGLQLYNTLQWTAPFLAGCVLAKHDGLARVRRHLPRGAVGRACCLGAITAVFFLRAFDVCRMDCILAPVLALALDALLRETGLLARGLAAVGQQSMSIWLVHSFYCYHFCQAFVYSPKLPVLILALLLAMSWITARALEAFYGALGRLVPGRSQ